METEKSNLVLAIDVVIFVGLCVLGVMRNIK
jgi:hypothetical protein